MRAWPPRITSGASRSAACRCPARRSPRPRAISSASRSPIRTAYSRSPRSPTDAWTVRVEMIGFAAASREITIAEGAPPSTWELKLLPLAEMTRGLQPAPAVAASAPPTPASPFGGSNRTRRTNAPTTTAPAAAAATPNAGFQRAQVNTSAGGAAIVNDPAVSADADRGARRRLPDQRQRQQRRGVAVRAAGGVRQQPPRRALALQRRRRRPARQLRARRAAVLVHRPADAEAVLQRRADRGVVRRPAENPGLLTRTARTCFSATSGPSITTPARSRR